MRQVLWVLGLCVVMVSPSLAQEKENAADGAASERAMLEQILAEVRAVREEIGQLQDRVEALEEAAEEAEDDPVPPGWNRQGADVKALRKIELPDDPTVEQVEEYIGKIADASRGQNSYSSDDPQVHMLAEAGRHHIRSLIEAMDRNELDFYISQALEQAVKEEHKGLVLETLAEHKGLAQVVSNRGWEEDARDTLLEGLQGAPQHLPPQWIQAAATLDDPDIRKGLEKYLAHGANPAHTYRTIQNVPGIDLDEAVAEAWKRARLGHEWERMQMAQIAVGHGHEDALSMLIEGLDEPQFQHMGPFGQSARSTVLMHIDFHGTNDEIRKWYSDNRQKLRWNEEKRRFYVSGGLI